MRSAALSIILLALTLIGVRAERLELVVVPTVAGTPLSLDSLRYSNERYSISRLSFFLSDFSLITAKGQTTPIPDSLGWFDAGKRRWSVRLDSAPKGSYAGLQFKLGVPDQLNNADPWAFPSDHPLNPNLNGLYWNWQGGYIFSAIEGHFSDSRTGQINGFSYHFARSQNLTPITLRADFEISGPTEVQLTLDLAKVLHGKEPIDFERTGNSTHSAPGDEIASALKANFPEAFQFFASQSLLPQALQPSAKLPLYQPKNAQPARFTMSRRFPIPALPKDNPLIQSRVELGKTLFNDRRLSRNSSISCASCHQAEAGFSDSRRFSLGVENRQGNRQSMPLFNLAWKSKFFWDGRANSLREQVLMPVQDHLEMDLELPELVDRLRKDTEMNQAFAAAFNSPDVTAERIALALENFLLTLTSYNSKFDQVIQGKATFTPEEQKGFELFVTENEPRSGRYGADCFHCHGGPLFTDHGFRNNGLDEVVTDPGVAKVSGNRSDAGKFSTPSLRNIALTAPYMHDGRFDTLAEVVRHYSSGVKRSPTLDANLAKHPEGGLALSEADQAALVAFLKTLTDPKLVSHQPEKHQVVTLQNY